MDALIVIKDKLIEVLRGSSLEGCNIEVLSYHEDEVLTVAFDFIGKPNTPHSYDRVDKFLRASGLTICSSPEDFDIPSQEGLRIYTTTHLASLADVCKHNHWI